jgi:hypothetical protein
MFEPPPHTGLWKMVFPNVMDCCFVHRQARIILKTYSESSCAGGSISALYAFSELSNRCLKI